MGIPSALNQVLPPPPPPSLFTAAWSGSLPRKYRLVGEWGQASGINVGVTGVFDFWEWGGRYE